jgi:hypothetical protein
MSLETRTGFHPNQREFGLHVRSEVAGRPPLQVATKIAARANMAAAFRPKVRGDKKSRHLKGSYHARRDGNLRVGKHTRAIAVVESDVVEASTKEFGAPGQPAERPLLKAAVAVSIEEFGKFEGGLAGRPGEGEA